MTERTIFMAALEMDAGQRSAYLDQACAGDAALRRQVESLLAAHQREGEFLASPALADAGWQAVAEGAIGNTEVVASRQGADGDALTFLSAAENPGTLGRLGHHPAGRLVVLGKHEPATELRDIATGAESARLPAMGQGLAFRGDGRLLAAFGSDGAVTLWGGAGELAAKKALVPLPGVTAVALTTEGRYLAAAHADGTILVLRLAKPGEVFPDNPVVRQ